MAQWLCQYCSAVNNTGGARCPQCRHINDDRRDAGRPVGELDDDGNEIEEDDWDCPFCGQANEYDIDYCVGCGTFRYDDSCGDNDDESDG